MYGLLAGLLEQFLGTPAYNICILGAEQTGKTVHSLRLSSSSAPSNIYISTPSFRKEKGTLPTKPQWDLTVAIK